MFYMWKSHTVTMVADHIVTMVAKCGRSTSFSTLVHVFE